MTLYFAKSTNGFYDSEINAALPKDAVEITQSTHQTLMTGQSQGQVIQADSTGAPVLVAPPSPTTAQLEAAITQAIQAEIDATAKAHGYDNMNATAKYIGFANPFQAECIALATWCAACWQQAYAYMATVSAGKNPMPTPVEAVAMLPAYTAGTAGAPA